MAADKLWKWKGKRPKRLQSCPTALALRTTRVQPQQDVSSALHTGGAAEGTDAGAPRHCGAELVPFREQLLSIVWHRLENPEAKSLAAQSVHTSVHGEPHA